MTRPTAVLQSFRDHVSRNVGYFLSAPLHMRLAIFAYFLSWFSSQSNSPLGNLISYRTQYICSCLPAAIISTASLLLRAFSYEMGYKIIALFNAAWLSTYILLTSA